MQSDDLPIMRFAITGFPLDFAQGANFYGTETVNIAESQLYFSLYAELVAVILSPLITVLLMVCYLESPLL